MSSGGGWVGKGMLREGNERGKGIACVGKNGLELDGMGWENCEDGMGELRVGKEFC